MNYAEITLDRKTGQAKGTLTYAVPEELQSQIKIGQLVKIPLRNKPVHGIVISLHNNKPEFRTVKIQEILDQTPLLQEQQVQLLSWISQYYFCPLEQTLKLFIPKRVIQNKPFRQTKEKNEQINRSEPKQLTEEQSKTITGITESSKNKFLIHGVTGSGKTEIYTRLADHYIKQGKQALILVPEISLTPQTIAYFEGNLGVKAAIINSKLAAGKRYQNWQDIRQGKAQLIIGSRSAILSPFENLGIIIIDEEHENSYKQENSPRYHTHSVADKIISLNPEIKLVLGSATPSIETTEKLKESTFHIHSRIGAAEMPDIEIVDLREEFKKGNKSIFSESLEQAIRENLAQNRQTILFLNRRGSASSVMCRDCGYKQTCQTCETTMTYHKYTIQSASLICHHCGEIQRPHSSCPSCQSIHIRYLGIGTERIEDEVRKTFPTAKVLRADRDTTSKKDSFKKIYQDFKNHKADILIGTQMIAKGLHLPKVNLVGVILADIGLNIPNFRSAERNFQLMTQVAGRAGRSSEPGKVIIQTYSPDHLALLATKEHDYQGFFKYERTQRSLLKNPPFGKLATLHISTNQLPNVKSLTEELENHLWHLARKMEITEHLEITSYPSYIVRYKGKYNYTILIKAKTPSLSPHDLLAKLDNDYIINPNIKIDIDPISL